MDVYNIRNINANNSSEFPSFVDLTEYFKSAEGKKYFKPEDITY